jgi:heat-inducible transcriptional repressor
VLSPRQELILRKVVVCYQQTDAPVGSKVLSADPELNAGSSTIRNELALLEEHGLLAHPHTSAGRVPTDVAYRVYVDSILPAHKFTTAERDSLALQISSGGSAVENILRRAAQSLGIITQELGVALGPRFDASVLDRIELVRLASDRLLVVLSVQGGGVRTIYVDARGQIADEAIAEVSRVLNERLGGLTLREVRNSLSQRLRDTAVGASELINVFVEEGEHIFDEAFDSANDVMLGAASVLAEQPEFASADSMRRLVALTETRHYLAEVLRKRSESSGVSITIGNEHDDPALENFTLVTAQYHVGALNGVIGVIGPTRMPYDKVISLVTHTSQLVTDLLD